MAHELDVITILSDIIKLIRALVLLLDALRRWRRSVPRRQALFAFRTARH